MKGAAVLYHAYFTGLILMLASRKGPRDAGDWSFAVFRRQHHEKFRSSFEKLGLLDLPDAVACARYHYLSNRIGGVPVEYMEESDTKAWVRFCHPRWIYEGPALCGVPLEVGHGFIKGWYAHNGVTLGNPRLGFVCTSQDMTAEVGFAGYFQEYDRDLAADERLRFEPAETPPPFDPAAVPVLDTTTWPAERLQKANRNYAMEYIKSGLQELVRCFGSGEAVALGNLAAQIVGRQMYREVQAWLGQDPADATPEGFAEFMVAMGAAQDVASDWRAEGGAITVRQAGWRVMRGVDPLPGAAVEAWNGLWQGALAVHDRFAVLELLGRPDYGDDGFTWRLRRRSGGA
ncbi:MAG: hypothetical protein H6907_06880 [Hyphomicrobiales bacterium]|nr:hypothetical protein [Hyphomicrobiales bacterium]